MKVMLLNPPFESNFIRSARSFWPSISGSNWYPIFLAYAGAWLEKHGHQIKLVDALVGEMSNDEVCQTTVLFKPDLLVVYVSEPSLKNDLAIGVRLKELTGCHLVLVGPICAFDPERILKLNSAIDGVVKREFSDVILDLAQGKPQEKIKGLVFRQGKKIIDNGEREVLTPEQLDQFPFVTKIYQEHLPIAKYHQASLLHPFVDLFTAWGCPWSKCTFCLWPHTIHKNAPFYRTRNLEKVIEELKYIRRSLPFVKEIFIQDDSLPAGQARKLSELIIKNKLDITWSCYVRADLGLETLKIMKKSGCRFLHVGYESADEFILQNICKGLSPTQMKHFTKDAKKAGLKIHGDFILGLPGETKSTIKKTIQWAKGLGIEAYQFFLPQVQKGTPLYEQSYQKLSDQQLRYWRFQAMRKIYLSPKYIFNNLTNINSLADFYRITRTAYHVLPHILKGR